MLIYLTIKLIFTKNVPRPHMIFEKNSRLGNVGETAGFICAYFFFTSMLFIVLTFSNKIPVSWSFFHIMGITIFITAIGAFLKGYLK